MASSGTAVVSEREASGDGSTGAGHSGNKCEGLSESVPHGVPPGQLFEATLFATEVIGKTQQNTKTDEGERDNPERSECGFNLILEQQSEHRDWQAAHNDEPAHTHVGIRLRATAEQTLEPSPDNAGDVVPEVDDDRSFSTDLGDRGERGAGVFARSEERTDDPEVGAGRDRQELRQALNDAEDDRIQ